MQFYIRCKAKEDNLSYYVGKGQTSTLPWTGCVVVTPLYTADIFKIHKLISELLLMDIRNMDTYEYTAVPLLNF